MLCSFLVSRINLELKHGYYSYGNYCKHHWLWHIKVKIYKWQDLGYRRGKGSEGKNINTNILMIQRRELKNTALFNRTRNNVMVLHGLFLVVIFSLVLNPLTLPLYAILTSFSYLWSSTGHWQLKCSILVSGELKIFILHISLQASFPQGSLPLLSRWHQIIL